MGSRWLGALRVVAAAVAALPYVFGRPQIRHYLHRVFEQPDLDLSRGERVEMLLLSW
jgi:hypothetical protein